MSYLLSYVIAQAFVSHAQSPNIIWVNFLRSRVTHIQWLDLLKILIDDNTNASQLKYNHRQIPVFLPKLSYI